MKKTCSTLVTLLFFFIVMPVFGQSIDSWKNLSRLSNCRDINLVIDFSDASIVNDIFEDWVRGEPDWEDSYNEICSKFRRSFNKIADKGKHPHRVGSFPNADYTLTFHVLKATKSGSKVSARAEIANQDCDIIFSREIVGKEGRWGSVANLMGDAFDQIGSDFGMNFMRYAK